ncbi:MAG: sulfatase-like hydrolase/transferase [Verrucomicrobiales bacterium]
MKLLPILLLLLAPLGILAIEPEEERLGFVEIFDGTTFDGWEHGGNWVVEDGAFHRKERGGSLTYVYAPVPDDFEVRFEWKVSKGCNSGVYYRPGQVEYQVLDDANSPYGKIPRQAAASLFFCMAPGEDATRPYEEWNTGRILCQGTVIEHWLNGKRVVSFDYTDPKWKEEVDLLGLRGGDLTGRGGRLHLQDHGQDVWYRNIRWREIPEDETVVPDPDFSPIAAEGEGLASETARVKRMIAAVREAAPRPNLVVIMADDLGWGDVGCYGPSSIPTPNIDRLASEGMKFTDAHSPSAICSPARYGLLAGTDPCRRYHTSHVLFNGEPLVVGEEEDTVASIVASVDYRTGIVGKWHLGLGDELPRNLDAPGRGPNQLGFDTSFLVPDGHNMKPLYYLENGVVVGDAVGGDPVGGDSVGAYPSELAVIERVGYRLLEHRADGDWPTRRPPERIGATLVDKAVNFLESALDSGDEPFFLYLPTCAIHTPHVPDPRFAGKSEVGAHGDCVMEFDWTVGEVMAALDRLGAAEDTLLVVASDNGGLPVAAKYGHDAGGPWSGLKGSALEGGHRVPFVARWPGRIAAGSTSDALLSLTDLPATAAALAGAVLSPMAALDSFDQSPVLLGEKESVRDSVVIATRGCAEIVWREGSEKLTLVPETGEVRRVDLSRDPEEKKPSIGRGGDDDRSDGMLRRLHQHFERGGSRPRAVGAGSSLSAILREREARNRMILERFGPK